MANMTLRKIMPAAAVAMLAAIVGSLTLIASKAMMLLLLATVVGVAILTFLGIRALHFLDKDEQLRVQYLTETMVHNGPGLKLLNPFGYRSATVVKAEMLSAMDYVCVMDTVNGSERVQKGPQLLFLGPHEEVSSKGVGMSLGSNDYVLVEHKLSGEKQVVAGPCVWFPASHETGKKGCCVSLGTTEYIIVQDKLSGEKRVVKGPSMFLPGPHDEVAQKGNSITLSKAEYITVENTLTGELTLVKGPCTWFRGPYDNGSKKQEAISLQDDEYILLKDVSSGKRWIEKGPSQVFVEPMWKVEPAKNNIIRKAWVLKANEYIRLVDGDTGSIAVHRGEKKVFPGPDEAPLDNGVQKAVEVDGEHAVLVRDKRSGQLRLVTEQQLFVPEPHDTIEEIRELIKLAEHEAMILKDIDGNFQYYYGCEAKRSPEQPKAFFLPPHSEIVKVWWSRGPRRERRDVFFERFECRPHFMKFEFNCRTADNVELILEGVLFWQLVDLPAMWRHTGDTSGDMVYHTRSKFIHHVAQVTLKTFMETLHDISKQILEEDITFYSTRGIKVHSLEVTRYQCADKSTADILEQIIQETTNRMNRLSQAESENEVNLFRTQGQVEQSRVNSDLLALQRDQQKADAEVAGHAESDRVATFLKGLESQVPLLEDRIRMWQVLRKTEALSVVASGGANLYFTPNDVDLSIETKQPIAGGGA
jgi:hypothetical protein